MNNKNLDNSNAESRVVKIALAQFTPENGCTAPNLKKIRNFVKKAAADNSDIICFPELAQCGFYMKQDVLNNIAEPQNGEFITELSAIASLYKIHIACGYAEKVNGVDRPYNSFILIDDSGKTLGNMRKFYLWGREKDRFAAGDNFPVISTRFGKIGLLNCYDAEYPETSRIEALKGAELILVCAAWSIPGKSRWDIQLPANALCNLLFVAGVNMEQPYCCGSSKIIGPDGLNRAICNESGEQLLICEIDLNDIYKLRKEIPYMDDFNPKTFSSEALKTL